MEGNKESAALADALFAALAAATSLTLWLGSGAAKVICGAYVRHGDKDALRACAVGYALLLLGGFVTIALGAYVVGAWTIALGSLGFIILVYILDLTYGIRANAESEESLIDHLRGWR